MAIFNARYLGMVDVPETQKIEARFDYSFFVPDERTNRSGTAEFHGEYNIKKHKNRNQIQFKKSTTQSFIDTRVLQAQLPRSILINFDPVNCGDSNILDMGINKILESSMINGQANTEDTFTSKKDTTYRFSDRSVRARLTEKARLLTNLLNVDSNNIPSQISEILMLDETINEDELREILSPESTPGVEYINDVGKLNEPNVYAMASSLRLDSYLDRRLLKASLAGDYTYENILKTENFEKARKDSLDYLPVCSYDNGVSAFHPTFTVIANQLLGADDYDEATGGNLYNPENQAFNLKSSTIGYIIDRLEMTEDGKLAGSESFIIDSIDSTSFLDSKIVYGSTYTYTVRTIAVIETIIVCAGEGFQNEDTVYHPGPGLEQGYHKIWSLVSSRPSKQAIVEAVERTPPLEPDGIFYRYNYDGGGLIIRWQIPVGKQRDVKYFQIFRRKTIYDPFTCIAELDFDDSTIVSTRREKVINSRTAKFKTPMTQFIDPEYTRDSSYIYAVVALDAHGLTSGYSAQTLVTFNNVRNVLELKNISKPGAPKQYPNFFIDPDLDDNIFVDSLTQDAMFSSHKKKINIYFDPDAVNFNSKDGRTGTIISTTNEKAIYQLLLYNIDRQKSITAEIRINNLGSS